MTAASTIGRRLLGLRGFLPLIAGLAIWELVLAGGTSPFFPPPSEWYAALSDDWAGLVGELGATLKIFATGLLLATVAGAVAGIAIGTSRLADRALAPLFEFLRSLPSPTIIPIAVLVFGQGQKTQIFAVLFASVWPVLLNAASAARGIEPLLLDVGRTFHVSRIAQIWKVVLPYTVPSIMLGVRVALPIAVIVTILSEMLAPNEGIGAALSQAQVGYMAADVFGLLFVVGVLGYLLNALIVGLEQMVLRRWPVS